MNLPVSRRGFLGTLAGLVLGGRIIGPKLLATPSEEVWRSIPQVPRDPIESYLSLEAFSSAVVGRVGEEIKHLRRSQHLVDEPWREFRRGHYVGVREPVRYCPRDLGVDPPPGGMIMGSAVAVAITEQVFWNLPDDLEWPPRTSWGRLAARYVEPCAYTLAGGIIALDRIRGGSDYLVTVAQEVPAGIRRAVNARSEETQLAMRVMECPNLKTGQRLVRADMLLGFGDKSERAA